MEFGIDIVIHSATKYLGGHSDLVAGLVVVKDEELGKQLGFLQNAVGAILQPFDSFLLIRGIKTLGVRLDRHVENAEFIVEKLQQSEDVKKIYYPGLKTHPGYEINRKQALNGGAMISFELTDGHDVNTLFRQLQVITLAESLGGVESLIEHPASMTHASIRRRLERQRDWETDFLDYPWELKTKKRSRRICWMQSVHHGYRRWCLWRYILTCMS